MKKRNDDIRKILVRRHKELKKLWVVGDKTPIQQLTIEAADLLPGCRSFDSRTQMVRYFLKTSEEASGDARYKYTATELSTLVIATDEEINEYAERKGKTFRSVKAAVKRYADSLTGPSGEPVRKRLEGRILQDGYFNFSYPYDLEWAGFKPSIVTEVKRHLVKYKLSLRPPNLLYHPATKRRYALKQTEQVAILTNPERFLRIQAEVIKDRWVTGDTDPIEETQKASTANSADKSPDRPTVYGKKLVCNVNPGGAYNNRGKYRKPKYAEELSKMMEKIGRVVEDAVRLDAHLCYKDFKNLRDRLNEALANEEG